MAHQCGERNQRVEWDAVRCPVCGEENPLGRNPGDLTLMKIFGISSIALVIFVAYLLIRMVRTRALI
jgi:hypothetical protein